MNVIYIFQPSRVRPDLECYTCFQRASFSWKELVCMYPGCGEILPSQMLFGHIPILPSSMWSGGLRRGSQRKRESADQAEGPYDGVFSYIRYVCRSPILGNDLHKVNFEQNRLLVLESKLGSCRRRVQQLPSSACSPEYLSTTQKPPRLTQIYILVLPHISSSH